MTTLETIVSASKVAVACIKEQLVLLFNTFCLGLRKNKFYMCFKRFFKFFDKSKNYYKDQNPNTIKTLNHTMLRASAPSSGGWFFDRI